MPKTDSSPPKEVERLKQALREKEEADLEKRFFAIEKELREVKEMAETPHECERDDTFQMIKDSFASGTTEFELIHAKLDKMGHTKFWSVIGIIIVIVGAVITGVYTYARNEANWEHTTKRVKVVETTSKNTNEKVGGLTVSFRLMEQSNKSMEESNKSMEEKLDELSPKKLEDAVARGFRRGRKNK